MIYVVYMKNVEAEMNKYILNNLSFILSLMACFLLGIEIFLNKEKDD